MEDSEFRINKAKVRLQKVNPFFSYLALYLNFKEIEKGKMGSDTMGVSEDGEVFYVDEWVKKLSDEELMGVITHELLHLALLTNLRQKDRSADGWNCASDLAINSVLKLNGFSLPKGIVPDDKDELDLGNGKVIKEVSKKTAEEIYDEFPQSLKQKGNVYVITLGGNKSNKGKGSASGGDGKDEGKEKELGRSFDIHIKGKGKDGKELSGKEKKELEKIWLDRVEEAITHAKMKGDVPIGLERLIKGLHTEEVDWKSLLNQYITNQIPYDSSWAKPSKKSVAMGVYQPYQIKERIDIVLMIDLSGSIGQKEYADFLSEVIGMAKAYQDRISIRVFSHDTECYDCGLIENGNIEKIKTLQLKGGGGTSFIQPLKYLADKQINPKCLLWFSDGYGDKVEKQPFPILWILSKGGSDELIKDSGEVIKLRG